MCNGDGGGFPKTFIFVILKKQLGMGGGGIKNYKKALHFFDWEDIFLLNNEHVFILISVKTKK